MWETGPDKITSISEAEDKWRVRVPCLESQHWEDPALKQRSQGASGSSRLKGGRLFCTHCWTSSKSLLSVLHPGSCVFSRTKLAVTFPSAHWPWLFSKATTEMVPCPISSAASTPGLTTPDSFLVWFLFPAWLHLCSPEPLGQSHLSQ